MVEDDRDAQTPGLPRLITAYPGQGATVKFREHDRVVLTAPVDHAGLQTGDVGTIVHVYARDEAYEVEFVGLDGHTAAVATVPGDHLRPVCATDLTHARTMTAATS